MEYNPTTAEELDHEGAHLTWVKMAVITSARLMASMLDEILVHVDEATARKIDDFLVEVIEPVVDNLDGQIEETARKCARAMSEAEDLEKLLQDEKS